MLGCECMPDSHFPGMTLCQYHIPRAPRDTVYLVGWGNDLSFSPRLLFLYLAPLNDWIIHSGICFTAIVKVLWLLWTLGCFKCYLSGNESKVGLLDKKQVFQLIKAVCLSSFKAARINSLDSLRKCFILTAVFSQLLYTHCAHWKCLTLNIIYCFIYTYTHVN